MVADSNSSRWPLNNETNSTIRSRGPRFLLISDAFGTSRSPLYVVLDGDVLSPAGRVA